MPTFAVDVEVATAEEDVFVLDEDVVEAVELLQEDLSAQRAGKLATIDLPARGSVHLNLGKSNIAGGR